MKAKALLPVLLLAACATADGGGSPDAAGGRPDARPPADARVADAPGEDPDAADTIDAAAGTPDARTADARVADARPPTADAGPCHIVVSEVQVVGASSSADEFVELHNPCPTELTLPADAELNYRSNDGGADLLLVDLADVVFAAGSYRLYIGSGYTGDDSVADGNFGGSASGRLAAGGGGVAITSGTSIIDSVGYGDATNAYVETDPAPAPGAAMSIGRAAGADSGDNSADFTVGTPSPKAAN
jgi:hypothetical protein